MTKKYHLSLHIFRRDLRLQDNTALIRALELSLEVIPCFILDERQIVNNPYKFDNALIFMMNSLWELNSQLMEKGSRLYVFKGIAEEVVEKLLLSIQIQAVFFNRDYTPFATKRDEAIKAVCKAKSVDCNIYADALLNEPEAVVKNDGTPYTVYTHYLKKARTYAVSTPAVNRYTNYYKGEVPGTLHSEHLHSLVTCKNNVLFLKGGGAEAVKLLSAVKDLTNYKETRNYPFKKGTSHLSAHIKFGTVSIREVFYTAKQYLNDATFIHELYWRDFFTSIAFHFPHVFKGAFHKQYDALQWANDKEKFELWTNGLTGFPIVDAGMRQLNTTGWMHNRVRMIVASFLVKDLHIDWRWGERYFATKLIDYDPSVNNGNWQWAASTGCDAQPYFRIFNPWLQQKKYDPECEYIKRWIPELQIVSLKDIHNWVYSGSSVKYPKPILDHVIESSYAKGIYKSIFRNE